MFGSEGASDYLRGAAGQHGDPAQDGERKGVCSCRLMKREQFIVTEMAQNVALRSDRSVGGMPRSVLTNAALATLVTLLKSCNQKRPQQQKNISRSFNSRFIKLLFLRALY